MSATNASIAVTLLKQRSCGLDSLFNWSIIFNYYSWTMLSHFSLNLVPRFHCFLSAPFELFLRTSGALPFAGVLFPSLQKPHLRNMCFAFRKCSCLRTAGRERVGAVWAGSDEAEMGTRGDRGLLLGGLPWSTFVSFFDGDGLTKVFRSFEGEIGFLGGGLPLGFPSPLPLTKGGFGP